MKANDINKKLDIILEKLDQTVDKNDLKAIDKRFESIDMRFNNIDKRFKSIDQRFESIDLRFDNIERDLNLIWAKQKDMDFDLGIIKDVVISHTEKFDTLIKIINIHSRKIDENDVRLSFLELNAKKTS